MRRLLLASLVAVAVATGAALVLLPRHQSQKEVALRLAVPVWTRSLPVYVALDQGFFRDQGLRIDLRQPLTGKDGVAALVRGEVDIAAAGHVPTIGAILQGKRVWVLGSICHSDSYVGIVIGPGMKGIDDLEGKRVGVTRASTVELFLRVALSGVGLSIRDVDMVDLRPDEMAAALADGRIEAATTVAGYLEPTAAALPGSKIVRSDGSFLDDWLLLAAEDLPHRNPEAIVRLLRALAAAEDFIQSHPEDSRQIRDRYVPERADALTDYTFALQLDMVIARTMANNARILNGTEQPFPNFADYLYTAGLGAVRPEAVKVFP